MKTQKDLMMELKFDDEVFRVYALSIGVLIAKFLLMSFLTARQRFANLVSTPMH